MATFRVLDHAGRVLVEEVKVFNHRRYSMRCAAQQKFLDSLFVPGAAEGRIIEPPMSDTFFRFDQNGRSQHYFPK